MDDFQIDEACSKIALNPNIHFVIGRQGSGKTRIALRMEEKRLAIPVFGFSSIKSRWVKKAIESRKDCPEQFWASITSAAVSFVSIGGGSGVPRFDSSFRELVDLIERFSAQHHEKPLLLIYDSADLIESRYLRSYAEALFEFQRMMACDQKINKGVRPIVFCRPELLALSPENMEQTARRERCLYL